MSLGCEKNGVYVGYYATEREATVALFADKAKQNGGTRLIDGYSGSKRVSNFRARDYKPLLKNLESI